MSIEECETMVAYIMATKRFEKVKEELQGTNLLISCRPCLNEGVEGKARAFLEINPTKITLCTNRIQIRKAFIEDLLSHELVHAYDYLKGRCDFQTCLGLAYSEVRAAREGECRGFFLTESFRVACIRNHAIKSTSNLFPNGSKQCVDEILPKALTDLKPF
jgi:hypothetical protein